MKSDDCPWCICETDGNKITFHCENCDQKHIFGNTGMAISRFLEISEAFCELHKNCKEK